MRLTGTQIRGGGDGSTGTTGGSTKRSRGLRRVGGRRGFVGKTHLGIGGLFHAQKVMEHWVLISISISQY